MQKTLFWKSSKKNITYTCNVPIQIDLTMVKKKKIFKKKSFESKSMMRLDYNCLKGPEFAQETNFQTT